jgi:hypothetical protein
MRCALQRLCKRFRQNPGNWGELYSKALRTSRAEALKLPRGQEGYLETNLKLLDRAQVLTKQEQTIVKALVVWNKESRGPDDVSVRFAGLGEDA